jgi:hypothetical protein
VSAGVLAKLRQLPAWAKVTAAVVVLAGVAFAAWLVYGPAVGGATAVVGAILGAFGLGKKRDSDLGLAVDLAVERAERAERDAETARRGASARARAVVSDRVREAQARVDADGRSDRDVLDALTAPRRRAGDDDPAP